MPVNFGTGFNITAKEPIDKRLVLTKMEMLTERYTLTGATIAIPDNYICLCVDDNRLYVYNSGNERSPETGKFRLESGLTSTEVVIEGQTYNQLMKDGLPIQVASALTDGNGSNISEALAGMQPLITVSNKLNSDLVSDSQSYHKFVSLEEKNYWNSKQGALPAGAKDTYLHKHKDTGDIEWVSQIDADKVNDTTSNHKFVSIQEKAAWNDKQDKLPEGANNTILHKNNLTGDIEWVNTISSDNVDDQNAQNKFVTDAEKQTWDAKQDPLPAGSKDTFLHKNKRTGSLEWVPAETIHIDVDDYLSPTSTNPVQNKVIYEALQHASFGMNTYSCGTVPSEFADQLFDDVQYKRAIIVSGILYQYQKCEVDPSDSSWQYATFQSMDWSFRTSNLLFKFIVVKIRDDIPQYIDQYNVSITKG